MDEYKKVCEVLVQLARLVVTNKMTDSVRYLQRVAFTNRNSDALVWMELNNLTKTLSPSAEDRSWTNIARTTDSSLMPHDVDAQLDLLTREPFPIQLDATPIFERKIQDALDMVIKERKFGKGFQRAGLTVSNKLLFCGPPGVGKTLAAKWLSNQLGLPLYTLNLATVMSSFLGKTGNNIQQVFRFVATRPCILLLDEFDAIAKKRGDDTDIGELKRLVTVLLQEFDTFPNTSMLIAATNHQALLDPAVWRRFDTALVFPMPDEHCAMAAIESFFGQDANSAHEYFEVLAASMAGLSFSDIKRNVSFIRKRSMIDNKPIGVSIVEWIAGKCAELKPSARKRLSLLLIEKGYSQREVSKLTGVSRDTIRRAKLEVRHG